MSELNQKDREENERTFSRRRWEGCPMEEEYFGDDRKADKLHRKIIKKKDRSKYKKTDLEKWEKGQETRMSLKIDKEGLLKGRVISIISQGIVVGWEEKTITCILRGTLKQEKRQIKNLVTVGDIVLFELTSPGEGVIAHIEPRKTILSRADNLSRRKEQLIAANVDQVLITASVVDPALKPFLVDRYIIATQKGGMNPIIVVNKIDLLDGGDGEVVSDEKELYQQFVADYAAAGIPVVPISVKTGEGVSELLALMKDKVSVFSGQSGVGKTSLINLIAGLNLRVRKTVEKTGKGSHTTTSAQLLPLDFGGWCIDTPGIKSFGIWNLKKEEVEQYFTEIYDIGSGCHFPDCTHTSESKCAVFSAVEEGKISFLRYQSYLALIGSIDQEHVRR